MITIKTRRLDRITLVRQYKSLKAESEFLGTLSVANVYAQNGDLKKYTKKHATTFVASYAGKAWSTGVSFNFFSIQKCPAIAINFTPSKLADDDWADFLGLLETMFPFGAKQVWMKFKLSKLEIAVDVKVPLKELACLVTKVTEYDSTYLPKGTLYLGHKYGQRSYCIYDKRKQLVEKAHVDLGHDLSRIEVRLRPKGMTLQQIGSVIRPFGNLVALRRVALDKLQKAYPLSIELKAFVKSVLAGQLAQQAYLDLDPYSRKLLMKVLKPNGLNLNGKEQDWGVWIEAQHQALKSKFMAHEGSL